MNYREPPIIIGGLAAFFLIVCAVYPLIKIEKKIPDVSVNKISPAISDKKSSSHTGPPVIGTFGPLQTDAGCWFYRRDMKEHGAVVFYYFWPDDMRMNINGKDLKLTEIDTDNNKVWKFKVDDFRITLELGPEDKYEGPCGVSYSFPSSQLTVTENGKKTTVLTKGQCGCG